MIDDLSAIGDSNRLLRSCGLNPTVVDDETCIVDRRVTDAIYCVWHSITFVHIVSFRESARAD